jgi:MerR family mercuric resistance operon transcriptional regulator
MPKTAVNRAPPTVPFHSDAAEVGVETVRYYQRRRLSAVPHSAGGVRGYPATMIDRIRFLKRS